MNHPSGLVVPEQGVHVVRAGEAESFEIEEAAHTVGLGRRSIVWPLDEGGQSDRLWVGRVSTPPGMDSGPHHHGESETSAYVMSGHFSLSYGEEYEHVVELGPGDFIYLRPGIPHIERNLSTTESVEFIAVRHPRNIVVNL